MNRLHDAQTIKAKYLKPEVATKAVALVESITKAIHSGIAHYDMHGNYLRTTHDVLKALKRDGEVHMHRGGVNDQTLKEGEHHG